MSKVIHVGIDIGSTTVKSVVMDENENVIYTLYKRHFSDTKKTVCDVIEELIKKYDTYEFTVGLTGSGAMSTANFLELNWEGKMLKLYILENL